MPGVVGTTALSEPMDKQSHFGSVTVKPCLQPNSEVLFKAHLQHLLVSFIVPPPMNKIIIVIRESTTSLLLFMYTYLCEAFCRHCWIIPQHMK